jgi:predicted translin family RNA/ssDNA-binding protein
LFLQASRDVTNLSKKIIFLLHRIMTEDTKVTDRALSLRAAAAGREKLAEITAIYADIGNELQGDRFWRYHKCISPSIQEFIEALSFMHYLEHGTLVTVGDVQRTLSDRHGVPVSMDAVRLYF